MTGFILQFYTTSLYPKPYCGYFPCINHYNRVFHTLFQSYLFKFIYQTYLLDIQLIQRAFYLAEAFGSYMGIYLRGLWVFMAQ